MSPASKQTKGKSKAKTAKNAKGKATPSIKLPKVIPAAAAVESNSDSESSNRENDVRVRNVKKKKNTQPLASASTKENTRPGPSNQESRGRKPRAPVVPKGSARNFEKRALQYHILKREVLAPFLTKLFIRTRADLFFEEELIQDTNDTINMDYDDSNNMASRHTLPGFTTTVNSDDNESRASYQDDWRTGREEELLSHSDSD